MGDRFYAQQKDYKPGRRLKKDVVIELNSLFHTPILGLERLTIATLDELIAAVQEVHSGDYS